MLIKCLHGYFIFEPSRSSELSEFASMFGFEIELNGDHFTFADLVDAPNYSILGGTFLKMPTIKTMEGKPWEVMRANKLTYDFTKGLVLPIVSILRLAELKAGANYFLSSGMIVPGSLTEEGLRVTEYAAFFDFAMKSFRYTEVTLE